MNKKEIIKKLISERQKLLKAIKGLKEKEITEEIVAGEWTTKDILGHLASWDENFIKGIKMLLEEKFPPFGEWSWDYIHKWNLKEAKKKKHLPLSQILGELNATHQELLDLVEKIPTRLIEKNQFPRKEGGSILYYLWGSWEHNSEHYPDIFKWKKKGKSGSRNF